METKKSFHRFMIIWLGEFISSIGSGLTDFGLGVYVYQITHSAASVALVTICAFLPTVLLGPIGGVLADRFDRRVMMIIGDFFSVFGLVYIVFAMHTGNIALWQILIGVAISSVFVSLLEPAYKATITDLLSEEEYAKASGMVQIAGSSKYLISPVIAGFLIARTNIETLLMIDISTFFVTVIAVLAARSGIQVVKKVHHEEQGFFKDMKEGWQIIYRNKGILWLTALTTIAIYFIGFIQILFTPMILTITDAANLGIMTTVSASGMLAGSVIIGIANPKKQFVRIMSLGLCMNGIALSLFGVSTNLYFIGIMGFLFFMSLPFVNTSIDVMIRKNIANEYQGRIWGLLGLISQMGYIFAYVSAGNMADYIFEPLMAENGALADTIGQVIGVGPGRGIGLLVILSGIFMLGIGLYLPHVSSLQRLESGSRIEARA